MEIDWISIYAIIHMKAMCSAEDIRAETAKGCTALLSFLNS